MTSLRVPEVRESPRARAEALMVTACGLVMRDYPLYKKREWYAYAAQGEDCPKCGVGGDDSCLNLVDVMCVSYGKLDASEVRATKWPHHERISWRRLYEGLSIPDMVTLLSTLEQS